LADVQRLNKISKAVLRTVDKVLDPTLLAKDTGMVSGNKLVMLPNTVLVGGLDHAGNPTVAPFPITYFSLDSSLIPQLPSYGVSQPLSQIRLTETHP
jgi:hypothetical protein